jgi:hypothetical protein
LRGDLEALRARGFGVSLTPGRGPLCARQHTLKALQVRGAMARRIRRVWHKLAGRQAAERGADPRPPQVLDIEVFEDANGDGGVKEAFLKDAALRR